MRAIELLVELVRQIWRRPDLAFLVSAALMLASLCLGQRWPGRDALLAVAILVLAVAGIGLVIFHGESVLGPI